MTDTQQFQSGDEVMITVTGRVLATDPTGGLIVEYIKTNGIADRIAIRPGRSVTMTAAPAPDTDELKARFWAARQSAAGDLDLKPSIQRDFVDRWNDAYPPGTEVFYPNQDGEGMLRSTTSGPARLYAEGIAVVPIAALGADLVLKYVEPIAAEFEKADA